jgi:hypothetical protein
MSGTPTSCSASRVVRVVLVVAACLAPLAQADIRFGEPVVVGHAYYVTGFYGFGGLMEKTAFGPTVHISSLCSSSQCNASLRVRICVCVGGGGGGGGVCVLGV